MADDLRVVLHDIGVELANRGASAGLGALAETRIGDSPTGRAALDLVDDLVLQYGDAAIEAIIRRIRARLSRRVDAIVDEAKRENDADLEATLARLKRERGEAP